MKNHSKYTLTRAAYQAIAMSGVLLLAACDPNSRTENDTDAQTHKEDNDDLVAAIHEIDPARIIKAIKESPERFPVVFGMVKKVTPGKPAERLGITPGALILERAGNFCNRFEGASGEGDLLWIDTNGEFHRDRVKDGICGFFSVGVRDFTPWYVLHGNRNSDWDFHVVAALAMHGRNPAMADRLWERALQKGYPADCLSNLCRMNIACALGDPDRATSFAKDFGPLQSAPEGLPHWESDWHEVSAVTGDYSWMVSAGKYFDGIYPDNELIKTHNDIADMQMIASRESDNPPLEAPSMLAKHMRRKSVLPELATSSPWTNNSMAVAKVQRSMYSAAREAQSLGGNRFEPHLLTQARDFYHKSWCGPEDKARDLDMTLEFTVKPLNGPSPSKYMREFHIGLANRTMTGGRKIGVIPPSARILSITFGFDTTSDAGLSFIGASVPSRMPWSILSLRINPFQFGGQSLFGHIPDQRPKPGERHTLRVVRVGNQAEAILDGKRIALVHVPPHHDDTGVCWFVSGVEVQISSFQIDMLY
jgi:hypothetical protein